LVSFTKEKSDITVEDRRVSKTHCLLFLKEGKPYIQDESSNGTFINGQEIGKGRSVPLLSEQLVVLVGATG